MSRTGTVAAFAPFVAASALHVVLLAVSVTGPAITVTKSLLMPLLALAVVIIVARRPRAASVHEAGEASIPPGAVALLLGAVIASWLGDGAGWFTPFLPTIPAMLGFFGLAHVLYVVLFWRFTRRHRLPWWTLAFALWWIGMLTLLAPHLGALTMGVAAYGLLLGATAALAATGNRVLATGGVLFLISDTVLALLLFAPQYAPPLADPLVMATYCAGQGLIAAGVLRTWRVSPARLA